MLAENRCRRWAGNGFDRYPDLVRDCDVRVLHPSTPSAAVVGRMVIEALDRGEQPRSTLPTLDAHAGDGSGAIGTGEVLLAPHPLYLRRPDAVEPVPAAGVARG
ncbi:MAG: hypothetical protein WCI74_09345 [Actinomycetes bacterium]